MITEGPIIRNWLADRGLWWTKVGLGDNETSENITNKVSFKYSNKAMSESMKSKLQLQADTKTVEDLVSLVKRGLVRIPEFQRSLRWESKDVILFFDSIYQGYPIGSVLMQRAYAPASVINYGPIEITAPESNAALWVVDGQQRLTALTVGLARGEEIPTTPDPEDVWVVYFDAEKREFHTPPQNGIPPKTWVPITQLLDASALSEWVFNWEYSNNQFFRKAVFEAGARIRRYEIPLYIVEADEEDLLREIFYRINTAGKPMEWTEVHDALFGQKSEQPSTLKELADELKLLGIGRPSEEQLLSAIIAFKGLDATRSISEHHRKDPQILRHAVQDSLPALKSALVFLKTDAEIPHLRLLPRSLPLLVLARFFALYPEPNRRTTDLLIRWTWRTLLGIKLFDERTLLRHSLNAIEDDHQELTVQRLLKIIPSQSESEFSLPQKFDARAADSRIALMALSSLHPLDLDTGKPLDIAELIETHDLNAFRKIVSSDIDAVHGAENRILLPPTPGGVRKELIELIKRKGANHPVLISHGINSQASESLVKGRFDEFLSHRSKFLLETANSLGLRLAGWKKKDRPSINFILQQTGEDE